MRKINGGGTRDDREFIVALYMKYERLMFAVARRTAPDLPSAWEDMVQDSLEKLIRHVEVLRALDELALLAYVTSTVRNTARNHLKRQAVRERLFTETPEDLEGAPEFTAPAPEDLVVLMERRADLLAVWPELTETDRYLLQGRYFLHSSDQELAAGLGCKPASIRMMLTRARRRALKLLMEREEGDHGKSKT